MSRRPRSSATGRRAADTAILDPGRTCWTVSPARDAGVLIDCESYYRSFHAAARAARRYILLAGWQFDSDVSLLRGRDRDGVEYEVRLLPFLRELCAANPELQVRVLCWDYSPLFYFQREWLQDVKFNAAAPGQIVFHFDDQHPVGGSQHQKLAVVDGALAFAGSIDLCNGRWDRRKHAAICEERCDPDGHDSHGPYHEVQIYVRGPAAADLQELFEERWISSGAPPIDLPPAASDVDVHIRPSVKLGANEVGLSRTAPSSTVPEREEIREIEHLLVAAIESAEHLVYVENQYYGSQAVLAAFARRMRDASKPKLQIVFVSYGDLRTVTERMLMGGNQYIMFEWLSRLAQEHGHSFGIYGVAACCDGGDPDAEKLVFIHSKVLIVDDRFLSIGSANLNNRSMGLDTEVTVSLEAGSGTEDAPTADAIRRVRVSLLAEHTGVRSRSELREFYEREGLVAVLDRHAAGGRSRLRPLPRDPSLAGADLRDPEEWTLEPDRPHDRALFEPLAPEPHEPVRKKPGLAKRAIGAWQRRRQRKQQRKQQRRRIARNRPRSVATPPHPMWTAVLQPLRRFGLPALILLGVGLLAWSLLALLWS